MTTRRDFLKLNVGAASVAMVFPVHALGGIVGADLSPPLFAFLHDPRIPEAQPLAEQLFSRSSLSFSADGDLGNIWLNQLQPKISSGETYIAGITSGHHAFSIQEASRDYGHALIQSEYYDTAHGGFSSAEAWSQEVPGNYLDSLQLNSPKPVLWLLGPSGIKFHG